MMGKTQKSSKGHSSGFIRDYRHVVETMGEVEGFGSSCRADSEDTCTPKRKCMSINMDQSNSFNVPIQVISASKMSGSERKDLEMRLRGELEKVRILHKKILCRIPAIASGVAKKRGLKQGISGRFESTKQALLPSGNLVAMVMKQCETLLKNLMQHKHSWVFNTPVDIVKLRIPDYLNIIKHPMDLGTIKKKLASSSYSSPLAFASDVRLTFTNAMTYNLPGNDVYIMADTLNKIFEKKWKPIGEKLAVAEEVVKREKEAIKTEPLSLPQKRKAPPVEPEITMSRSVKPKMPNDEKQELINRLQSLLEDLPDHIINFLKQRTHNANSSVEEDEIEIDIESLNDDSLFELRKLLNEYFGVKRSLPQAKVEFCEMEILVESGVNNSSIHSCPVNEPADEDIDIGGDDLHISSYPPGEMEKDTAPRSSKCSSSSSSRSDSGSSSSGTISAMDQQENSACLEPVSANADDSREGENAASERQVSPDKLYRAALLRSRFADTILKAREKTLNQGEKDPDKLRREREELEQQKREEKARLQAEAKAAEDARRQAEAEAAAEAKRKRELEREAARQALLQMKKTVEINENSLFLKDLEILGTDPCEHIPSKVHEMSPDHLRGLGGFNLGGSNPLEQLGLFRKDNDEEEEECGPTKLPDNDVEEGEID